MTQKYTPNANDKAIYIRSNGFQFGNAILRVYGNKLENCHSYTGKDHYYDIEGDLSPLTNKKDSFTCA